MIFSSYVFIFCFLPVAVTGYFMLSRFYSAVPQHLFLWAASLFFYGYWNPSYLVIIVSSMLANYTLAYTIRNKRTNSKVFLTMGILFNVGLLGYFKYTDFFIENINLVFSTDFTLLHIILPLGISFFTFQQLSFLISVYRQEEEVPTFIEYCMVVAFFPHLIAGPIVLYKELIPQFKDPDRRYINYSNMALGIYIFTMGLFKKIVLADTLSVFANNGFDNTVSLGLFPTWITALSYTFQIYFDFSGYCDMAIGLGKMLNIDLPINFNSPYKSKSISEFWKRWHITLGRALSNLIYIPLGGNRKGNARTYINLFITFLISGVWHGAAWTFIFWGILHGIFCIIERILHDGLEKIPVYLRNVATFIIVNFLWILFRASSMEQALKVYKGMFNINDIGIFQIPEIVFDGLINFPSTIDIIYVILFLLMCFVICFICKNTIQNSITFVYTKKSAIYLALLFLLSVIHMSRVSPFIYFNF